MLKSPLKVTKCPLYCIYDSKCELKHSIIARHPCKHVGLLKTLLMHLILMRHALAIVSMVMRSSYTVEAQSKLHTHWQKFPLQRCDNLPMGYEFYSTGQCHWSVPVE